jgi:uncharacterized membrane protein (DUF2068 family)
MTVPPPPRPAGVRLIAAYKLTKGFVQALITAVILWLVASGYERHAHEMAAVLRDHLAHSATQRLAERALSALTPRRLYWLAAALGADSIISFVEGWALQRGYRWAPWLIVGATGCLLPFEIVELVHRPRLGRLALLLINALIVYYLARQAQREHARHQHHGSGAR